MLGAQTDPLLLHLVQVEVDPLPEGLQSCVLRGLQLPVSLEEHQDVGLGFVFLSLLPGPSLSA